MRLISPNEYVETFFSERSAPCLRTVRAQIRRKELPGQIIGGLYYVDIDELDRQTSMRAKLASREAELASDPALAELLD
jgi:hypothetical protein